MPTIISGSNLALSKYMSSTRNKVKKYSQEEEEKLTQEDNEQAPYWKILSNTEIKQIAKKALEKG
jgi:hypothetical protein